MKLLLTFGMLIFLSLPLRVEASPQLVDRAPLENAAEEARARTLMGELRCLVCQNQSIEDSNADLALILRQIVREQVKDGKTNDQIKAYLVARYGEWVLMRPPFNARTYLLWGGPLVILLLAASGLYFRARNPARKSAQKSAALSGEEQAELDVLLAKDKHKQDKE
jgi:cytochrome c-type biogenesis protein CcmH